MSLTRVIFDGRPMPDKYMGRGFGIGAIPHWWLDVYGDVNIIDPEEHPGHHHEKKGYTYRINGVPVVFGGIAGDPGDIQWNDDGKPGASDDLKWDNQTKTLITQNLHVKDNARVDGNLYINGHYIVAPEAQLQCDSVLTNEIEFGDGTKARSVKDFQTPWLVDVDADEHYLYNCGGVSGGHVLTDDSVEVPSYFNLYQGGLYVSSAFYSYLIVENWWVQGRLACESPRGGVLALESSGNLTFNIGWGTDDYAQDVAYLGLYYGTPYIALNADVTVGPQQWLSERRLDLWGFLCIKGPGIYDAPDAATGLVAYKAVNGEAIIINRGSSAVGDQYPIWMYGRDIVLAPYIPESSACVVIDNDDGVPRVRGGLSPYHGPGYITGLEISGNPVYITGDVYMTWEGTSINGDPLYINRGNVTNRNIFINYNYGQGNPPAPSWAVPNNLPTINAYNTYINLDSFQGVYSRMGITFGDYWFSLPSVGNLEDGRFAVVNAGIPDDEAAVMIWAAQYGDESGEEPRGQLQERLRVGAYNTRAFQPFRVADSPSQRNRGLDMGMVWMGGGVNQMASFITSCGFFGDGYGNPQTTAPLVITASFTNLVGIVNVLGTLTTWDQTNTANTGGPSVTWDNWAHVSFGMYSTQLTFGGDNDGSWIQNRFNTSTAAPLRINPTGGSVAIGDTLYVSGPGGPPSVSASDPLIARLSGRASNYGYDALRISGDAGMLTIQAAYDNVGDTPRARPLAINPLGGHIILNLPDSPAGLPHGALWDDNGQVRIHHV